jgi:hypothetical protein
MAILHLRNAVDDTLIDVNTEEIQTVRDYPAGQCWIEMKNGVSYQPAESFEQVSKLWQEAK